jgi:hypothetical protein
VLFLVALETAVAQQVTTDFDHQANFSQYKTYSWQEIKPANSLWDARILSGHIKTGQRWSGQNRPTDEARD